MATVYNALCVKLLQSLRLSMVYFSLIFGRKEIESEQKVYTDLTLYIHLRRLFKG